MKHMSQYLKLNAPDIMKSIATSVFVAIVAMLYALTIKEGFDVFHTDWIMVGKSMLNIGVIALVGDIARRLFTDSEGTLHVPALGSIHLGK